jgi:dihydropteroate synthase
MTPVSPVAIVEPPTDWQQSVRQIDDTLSQRDLALDPAGYFIIYLDTDQHLICAKHYTTVIDERGLACDPDTGKPLPAKTATTRTECTLYTGRTAKELCVALFEQATGQQPTSLMDHAAYLGRELMRAEYCLLNNQEYIQD